MGRGAAAGIACDMARTVLLLSVSGGALAESGPATRLAIYTDDWDCAYPPAMEDNLCITLNGTDKIDETRVKLRIDGTPVDVRPRVIEGSRLVIFPLLYGAGRSEEHTSELQSLMRISYAVFCLKHKTQKIKRQ